MAGRGRGRVAEAEAGSAGVCCLWRSSPDAAPAGACLSPESPAISGGQRRRPQTRAAPPVSVYSGPQRPPRPPGFPQNVLRAGRLSRAKLGAVSRIQGPRVQPPTSVPLHV